MYGAGGPAGVNVCRALHAAGHDVIGADGNPAHLVWAEPHCAETVVAATPTLILIDELRPDAIVAQPEQAVLDLAEHQDAIPGLAMPRAATVRACDDKQVTGAIWAAAGLKRQQPYGFTPCETEPIPDHLHLAADRFGLPFWLRATRGAGARGATLVEDLRTGFHWIRYWQTRGAEWDWLCDEYLPGREFCWTSLWQHGELVAAFTRERLEWIYPHLAPSGRTGTPAIARVVHDPDVARVARAAVLAVDKVPHGIMAVDLVHDTDGIPRPTEINAGRWPTTSPLYSEIGVNMPDLHVRIAAGEHVDPVGEDIYPAGVTLSRHIDCGHVFTSVPVAA